ncbi:Cerevisin [Dactylellina cionopaga]|nr:Cerevisin [Dactylellina cionopaga]
MLMHNETRTWDEFFEDMGYNRTDLAEMKHTSNFGTIGSKQTFRAFTLKMTAEEVLDMGDIEGVALVEKPHIYTLPPMPVYKKSDIVYPKYPSSHHRNLVEYQLNKRQQTIDEVPQQQQDSQQQDAQQAAQQNDTQQTTQQTDAPWGLQRMSSASTVQPVGQGERELGYQYTYDTVTGQGVDVYVIDSGINPHNELGQRAETIWSYWDYTEDDIGHGTHVAGTVGGSNVGLAKNANLWGIKVLTAGGSGGGTSEGDSIIQGIEHAISKHTERRQMTGFMGSVINMSLGGPGENQAEQMALQRAADIGIHIVTAAGNNNDDGCAYSPGRFSTEIPMINVGAVDMNDGKADFSNYGSCITVWAPGTGILSADAKDTQ